MCISINLALPEFTIQRIIFVTLLIFWIMNKDINFKYKNVFFLNILAFFTISIFISSISSSMLLVSVKRFFYFLTESLIFFIIVQTSIKDQTVLRNIIKAAAYSLLVLSIIGIIERYTHFEPIFLFGKKLAYDFEKISRDLANTSDVTSFYPHRILFGVACSIGTVYFLFLSDFLKIKRFFMNFYL